MSTYAELVTLNKKDFTVEFMRIINNKNLKNSYAIYTNLHVDYGIVDRLLNHYSGTKRSEFNKKIKFFSSLLGRKIKLVRTDNDENYTRLIYTIRQN